MKVLAENEIRPVAYAIAEGPETLIRVEALHKFYEMGDTRVHALRGITLEIRAGEFVTIMGASGSGKSTFMNLLGCLDKPSEGHYWLDGTDVAQLSRVELAQIRNERIGFVFQGFNLLVTDDRARECRAPLIYAGIGAKERHRRSPEALERVGLGERIDHVLLNCREGSNSASPLRGRWSITLRFCLPTNHGQPRQSDLGGDHAGVPDAERDRQPDYILVTHEPDIADYARRIITFRDGM